MKKIVLVGGAGFIGHHLALKLKQLGNDVHVIDGMTVNNLIYLIADLKKNLPYVNMVMERIKLLEDAGIKIRIQDARNYHLMSKLFAEIEPQIVVHLAAVAHANRSYKDPHSTFDHSLRTLENVLDICISEKLKNVIERFIYFSSSMVYGDFKDSFVTEDSSTNPIEIYGTLKLLGEYMVRIYQQIYGLSYAIVRPSALYGERCISGRVIQKFIESAINGDPLMIYGKGEERLDFTYIEDLVDGLVLACFKDEAENETFNMTYGYSRSLIDTANLVIRKIGGKIVYKERDKLIPFRGTLSVGKARKLLGYDPANPIEIGVDKYMDWYLSKEEE